ncbi:hypothetical protein [Streptomyces sp. NPDC002537]
MKLGKRFVAPVAVCALAATGVIGAGAAQAAPQAPHPVTASAQRTVRVVDELSLDQLTELVTDRVRLEYPGAKLMLADGSSPTGPTRDMSRVTDWRFVFNTGQSAVRSVEITAKLDGEIGSLVTHRSPWGGVMVIDEPVDLTPAEAYDILRDAGHGQAFQYVSLVKPLVFKPHLQYHFSGIRGGCDGYAVNVDNHAVNRICG